MRRTPYRLSPSSGAGGSGPAPALDLDDVQGNILRAYRCPATTYLFLTVVDPVPARLWLAEMADRVTTARQHPPQGAAVNLAITFRGLARLGVPAAKLARLPAAFREGMAARAAQLGDPMTERDGQWVPQGWHEPFGPGDGLHLMVMVAGRAAEVADTVVELEQDFWQSGVTESEPSLVTALPGASPEDGPAAGPGLRQLDRPLHARRLDDLTEHFGYRDGISQPAVEGVRDEAPAGGGRRHEQGWTPIKAGEFIIGMPAEDGVVVDDVPSLTRNGSYLVLRKLEQDVAAFRSMVERAAHRSGLDVELVRAKLMGRWSDGTPLERRPDRPDPDLAADWRGRNDFHYEDDREGARCPIGSHIRRANPRGSLRFDGALEHRRRLIRRGMPYGPAYGPGTEGAERGLVFVCYQADIAGQFEFVQSQWISDGDAFALGADRDPVVADPRGGSRRMRFEGALDAGPDGPRAPVFVDTDARCVIVRGGEYFLVPGVSAIRRLARPDEPRSAAR